mmetsp:Transcript_18956/g.30781  ORF Transcript_18956/g.30781 Transcript_18956/m.30781 type:complete len:587 (+) Transcript_18956:150-1910(+)
MVSVSRLKGAAIDLGVAQIDRVRDIVSPQLARNFERLPFVLQGPMRELTSGRPVTEMTLDGIRTVSIGFLERIEAMLDHPSHTSVCQHKDDCDDDPGDEVDCVSTTSFVSRWGFDDAVQRFSRQSHVPRMLPLHKLRTFAVQLSRSATLKVTVLCVQDTASAVMKRLRVQDARQLLDRIRQSEEVAVRDRSASTVTALASRVSTYLGLERLLGEWFAAALFGRNKAVTGETSERSVKNQTGEDLELELVEVYQNCEADNSDSEEVGLASSEDGARQSGSFDAPNMAPTASLASTVEPLEFRLIVKNSFIEFDERPTCADMRRAHSWETIRSFGQSSILNSEPFTLHARCWEPHVQPSTSSNGQQTSASTSDPGTREAQLELGSSNSAPRVEEGASSSSSAPGLSSIASSPATVSSPSCGPSPPLLPGVNPGGIADQQEADARTTVMFRNVPTGFTREELLTMLDGGGFRGQYNFVYLPVDFTRNIGLGYALISLENPQDAETLLRYFDGCCEWGRPEHGQAACEASWSEPRQGLQEHIERYRNSPVMHTSVPDSYKPAIFKDGVRVSFPPPTKAIRPPRIRHLKVT